VTTTEPARVPRQTPTRRSRLSIAAAARGVPLATILVTVTIVVVVFLVGALMYQLREILLLIVCASFIALVLNPFVSILQAHGFRDRKAAVGVVVLIGLVAFSALVVVFGNPLAHNLRHLADELPSTAASAGHGDSAIDRLVRGLHLQGWLTNNAPKLHDLATGLAKPALSVSKGAIALLAKMTAVATLVVLLLLEAPRMRSGLMAGMSPPRAQWWQRVGADIQRSIVGYVVGDLMTSIIAGTVVGVTMMILGLPYPLLWAAWVTLVDFLPQIGAHLAGVPIVLFAATHSLSKAAILAVVFIVYQLIENHVLSPVIMSRTVRTSPLVIFIAFLVGGTVGSWIAGAFGAFVGALIAVPAAASLNILARELWKLTDGAPEPEAATVDAEAVT
jgi:predicted PurR-regulated permease PerM